MLLLINPHAGGGRARTRSEPARALLRHLAPQARAALAETPEAARALLRELPPRSRVVLMGGDGTVHQCLPELVAGDHELALVPCGSGNDTPRALGLSGMDWQCALKWGLEAPARPLDLGVARSVHGERLFVSSQCCGFDAVVGLRALQSPRRLGGMGRYLLATLREIVALDLQSIEVEIDDQPVFAGLALLASVLNTPTYGGGMPIAPRAQIDDGRLDVVIAGAFSRAGALAMLPRMLVGRHVGRPRVLVLSGRRIVVRATHPLPLLADGEAQPRAERITIEIKPAALRAVYGPR